MGIVFFESNEKIYANIKQFISSSHNLNGRIFMTTKKTTPNSALMDIEQRSEDILHDGPKFLNRWDFLKK